MLLHTCWCICFTVPLDICSEIQCFKTVFRWIWKFQFMQKIKRQNLFFLPSQLLACWPCSSPRRPVAVVARSTSTGLPPLLSCSCAVARSFSWPSWGRSPARALAHSLSHRHWGPTPQCRLLPRVGTEPDTDGKNPVAPPPNLSAIWRALHNRARIRGMPQVVRSPFRNPSARATFISSSYAPSKP